MIPSWRRHRRQPSVRRRALLSLLRSGHAPRAPWRGRRATRAEASLRSHAGGDRAPQLHPCDPPSRPALFHAAGPQMNMLGFAHFSAAFRQNKRDLFELRVDALLVLEVHDMAFDDMAVAADDFDELPGHGCSSFFAPKSDGI